MKYQQWILAAVLGAAILPGCKKEEAPPASTATPSVSHSTELEVKNGPAADAAKGAQDAMHSATEGAKQATNDAADKAAGAADTLTAEAQKQLNQAVEYIKENKLDLADKTLKEVEANEASLPASIKDQIPTVRKTLDAAKAANNTGIKMPAMGK